MSLPATFTYRAIRLTRMMLTRKRTITPDSALGKFFDDERIDSEFIIRVNGKELGFGAVLTQSIVPGDISEKTKMSGLGALAAKKAKGLKFPNYRARVRRTSKSSLFKSLSRLTGKSDDKFKPNDALSKHLSTSVQSAILRDDMSTDLQSFLITDLPEELYEPQVKLKEIYQGAYRRCLMTT